MNSKEHRHLPRLDAARYRGFTVVHWTMTIEARKTGWLNEPLHARMREVLLHAAMRYDLLCPAYCFMPDHLHLIWMGMSDESDQRLAAQFFRFHSRDLLAPATWQKQAFDHVLREEDRKRGAFAAVCRYSFENPVRAKLVSVWNAYPYSGAILPGFPDVDPRRDDYWETFWRIYVKRREEADEAKATL
jgi:REP element-mobilizing transposase RayT